MPFVNPWTSLVEHLCYNHQNAIRNTFFIVMTLHLTEAVLAAMICEYMDYEGSVTFKWTFQVFIHGLLSFRHLLGDLFEYESQKHGALSPQMKMGLADFAS